MQTRKGSAAETLTSVAIGLISSFLLNKYFMPAIGVIMNHQQNAIAIAVFTVVSMVRQFSIRRLFNWLSERFGF